MDHPDKPIASLVLGQIVGRRVLNKDLIVMR